MSPSTTRAYPADAPDPDIVRSGSTYYVFTTGTTWGNHIGALVDTSGNPRSGWATYTGTTYGSTALASPPSWETPNTQTSPGVLFWGGRWIMYYDAAVAPAASDTGHDCLAIATAASLSPTPQFTDSSAHPFYCQPSLGGAIDPSPYIDPATGDAWLVWKSNDGGSSQPARIWTAELSASGTGLLTAPVELLYNDTVTHPWERTVEDPAMVVVGGEYYLFFSGGIWDSPSYAEGYAQCAGPEGPCSQPQAGPLLSSYGNVAGPGGASLASDAEGNWYLAYAAWTAGCTSYACGGARELLVAPISLPSSSGPAGDFTEFAADGLDGRPWNAYDRSAQIGGPAVFGDPSAITDPADGLIHVYVHGANDHLIEYVNSGSGSQPWKDFDLTADAGGMALVGNPDAIYDSADGFIHVYVEAANGHLTEYVDSGADGQAWHAYDLTGAAAGGSTITDTPSALYDPHDGFIHIYVRAWDGHLVEYVDSDSGGVGWHAWDLTTAAYIGSPIASSPGAVYDPLDGLIHIYLASDAGHLTEYVNSNTSGHYWHAWDLTTGAEGGVVVLGTPAALADPGDGHVHVYVEGANGRLYEWVNSNSGGVAWHTWDLTLAAPGGAAVASTPSALYDVTDGHIHIYLRAPNGHLTEFVNSNAGGVAWHSYDLTGASQGPAVVAGPSAVVSGGVLHVFVGA